MEEARRERWRVAQSTVGVGARVCGMNIKEPMAGDVVAGKINKEPAAILRTIREGL